MATNRRNALGRGLDSLISMDDVPAKGSSAINEIPLSQIEANPDQPRRDFDPEDLEALAESIRAHGIIQPLSLRPVGQDKYQIIAGERRWRASKLAGLQSVPAYIREADDAALTEMALIENIQRKDLNPIEIALTLRKLIEQHNLTQERLSERVGMKRATIANYMRLVNLPAEVQLGLRDGSIDTGHGRALLSLSDPAQMVDVYKRIVRDDLSVRAVETLVREITNPGSAPTHKPKRQPIAPNHDFDLLRDHLSARFQTKVDFTCNKNGRGKITIPFANEAELERILASFDNINTK